MRALVTGANGLIGANLVRELVKSGYGVRAFVRPESDLRSLEGISVEIAIGDVMQRETLEEALSGCDLLFHAAAVFAYTGHSPEDLKSVAVRGTKNAIDAAAGAGVRRVVLTSSSVVFGSSDRPDLRDESVTSCDPDPAPYAIAKSMQKECAFQAAADLGVDLVAVCPTMSIGPHGYRLGPSNSVIVAYLNDPFRFTFPGGCNLVSVVDVARGHILAAERGSSGTAYIVGSENLTWPTIHRTISELCGIPGPFVQMNHSGAYVAAIYDELRSSLRRRSPIMSRAQAKMVGRYYWYSHEQALTLGFAPRPARVALAEAISWLVASEHIPRETRSQLILSREVYQARELLAERETALKVTA